MSWRPWLPLEMRHASAGARGLTKTASRGPRQPATGVDARSAGAENDAMSQTFFPMPVAPTLSDGVIVLDAHTLADAEAHHAGEDMEMVRRFDGKEKATLEQNRGAMARWMAMRAAGGPQFAYAMRDLAGVLMG